MKKYILLIGLLALNITLIFAQMPVSKNIDIKSIIPADDEVGLLNGLDTLLSHAANGTVLIGEINPGDARLSRDILNTLKGIKSNEKEKISNYFKLLSMKIH